MLSLEADASVLPSGGEKAIASIPMSWPISFYLVPLAAIGPIAQNCIVPFFEADASVWPSGEEATSVTESSWPVRAC